MALNLNDLFKWVKPNKRKDNVVFCNFGEQSYGTTYAIRIYHKWNPTEIRLLQDKIKTAIQKNVSVNLSEIKEFLPHRSISSIRCKVREQLIRLDKKWIGTFTVKNIIGGKDHD